MAFYIKYSTRIYEIYLKYIAPEDIHVYSIDEVFMDVTAYLSTYKMTAHELARTIIRDVLENTGITATAITWYVNGTQAKAEKMLTSGTYTFTLGTDATATAGTQYTIKAVVTTANVDYTRSVAVEYSNE